MILHPYETQSDSFYFVDNKLVMHNKADYSYSGGPWAQAGQPTCAGLPLPIEVVRDTNTFGSVASSVNWTRIHKPRTLCHSRSFMTKFASLLSSRALKQTRFFRTLSGSTMVNGLWMPLPEVLCLLWKWPCGTLGDFALILRIRALALKYLLGRDCFLKECNLRNHRSGLDANAEFLFIRFSLRMLQRHGQFNPYIRLKMSSITIYKSKFHL